MTTPNSGILFLAEIEMAAQECLEFTENMSFGEFSGERKTQAAVVWQICVIGEAANRVPPALRQQSPEIPWRRMIGMRNKLIHDFREIDYFEVWRVAQEDLRLLITSVRRLLNNLDNRPR